MPVDTPEQTLKVVEIRKTEHHVECPRCGGHHLKRKRRESFLERRVFSAFGYYPWKCSRCGGSFQLKKRGLRPRHQSPDELAVKTGQ